MKIELITRKNFELFWPVFKTIIEDGVFIGSDTQLIAPVTVGKGATIGAGSTITKDTPDDQLTLSRAKQISLNGWRRPVKG